MTAVHFSAIADSGFFSFGGFTCVRPREWKQYLQRVLGGDALPEVGASQKNDCVLTSLEKYLLAEYGVFIPKANLFQFYNLEGEGISPEEMVEVISSIVEPLGFEIERIVAPDPDLRAALNSTGKAVGLEDAVQFEGRNGIGMINIEAGYSHAFFWQKIDTRKFRLPQFRMAVLVCPQTPRVPAFSALGSLETYAELVREAAEQGRICPVERAQALVSSLEDLLTAVRSTPEPFDENFCEQIDERLAAINTEYQAGISDCEDGEDDRFTAEIGEMVRRIFREII